LLIPARTDTTYFHDYIYGKAEIRFIRGRLRFTDELSNFQFEQSGSGVRVDFDCATVYGKDQITWEAKGVKIA